jgi:hypothetical protein
MMRMTESLSPSMRVLDDNVWIRSYANWLQEQSGPFAFPSRDFDATVAQFVSTNQDAYWNQVLTEDSTGRVRAIRLDFLLELGTQAAVGVAIDALKAWDAHVKDMNSQASIRANNAFHASSLWVRAQAQDGIISSTSMTVAISIMVGFFAMLTFTCDLKLACLSMASSALTIISLLFVMVVCMGWAFGAIEVVALIVFLGYLFSFNLHMSHAYRHAYFDEGITCHEERRQRVQDALKVMGRSLLGSSITTAGCAVFLVFCTLQFFVRFGIVILSVTMLSLVYSLIFLPVLLLTMGPTKSKISEPVRKPDGSCGLDSAESEPVEDAPAPLGSVMPAEMLAEPASTDKLEDDHADGEPPIDLRPSTAPPAKHAGDPPEKPWRPATAPAAVETEGPTLDDIMASIKPPTPGSADTTAATGLPWCDNMLQGLAGEIEEEEV